MADPKILLTAEDRTKAAFDSAKKGLTDLRTHAEAVTGVLAALGASAYVADLAMGIRATINEWDELGKAAQRAGFQSAQGIAEFQYAAKLSGVEAAGFETAIGKLSDKMADAAGGGEKAIALFRAMGVRIKDASGHLRNTEAVVTDLAKAFAGWKDGPEKTALALELFGKSGKELIPLLNGGADGLEKLRTEFRLLHGALGEGTTKAAEQFNDNLTKLSTAAGGLKRELAEQMLPGLVQITEAMVEQAKQGNALLAVWAGLKEFAAIGTNTDDTGNKIRNAEWLNQQMKAKGAQLSLLVDAKAAGGDADGQLQARIDQLRKELEALQKSAFAASRAVKQVFNPGYTDGGGTTGDFVRLDRAGASALGRAPTPAKGDAPKESAYAAVNKTVMERLALQKQELAAGRELTEMEKLEAKALEDLNLSKVKVTASQRKDIESKLQAAKTNEVLIARQRQDEKDRMAAGQAWVDEQKAIADFADKQKKREEDQLQTGKKTLEQIEFEISLLTMNNQQREVAIALRDLESQGIKQGTAAWEAYAAQIRAAVEKRTALQERVDQFKSIWESLDRTAHDVWVNIFEGGSNVFKKLGQVLKASLLDLLYQMTIRKWIISIGAGVGVPGASMAQSALGSAAGGVGGSMLGGLGNFASGLGSEIMGGTLFSNIGAGMAGVGGSFASTVGAGLATDAMGATVAANSAAATLGAGSSIGSAMAAIPVWGWAAMAAMAIAALAKGGETRSGGKYTGLNFIEGPSGGEINAEATRTAIGATQAGIAQLLNDLGATATLRELQSGFEQSERGKGFAYAGGTLSTGASFGQTHGAGWQNRRGNMTAEQAAAAFGEELKQATLQALQAADVPGQLGTWLRSLGDIEALSGGALDAALARINKALAEKQTLEEQLYVLTHTELEVLNRNRQRERDALDESNRALYDEVMALQDLRVAAETAAAATDSLLGAVKSVQSALRDVGDEVQRFADAAAQSMTRLGASRNDISEALFAAEDAQTAAQQRVNDIIRDRIRSIDEFLGDLTGNRAESLSSLKARLSATSVLAAGGDSQAQANLIKQAQAVLKAAEAGSSSRADYARQEAFVRQQLLTVRGAGTAYLQAAPGGSTPPAGPLEAALADLRGATQRTADLMSLAAETGASTDRAMRDAAGSITSLSSAYYQALSASTRAQADYSIAIATTAGLQLSTAGRFDALNESLAGLDTATAAAGVTLAQSAGLLGAEFDALRAKLSGLLGSVGATSPAQGAAAAITDADIRGYIAGAAPLGGTESEVRAIYAEAIKYGVSSDRIDQAMKFGPGTAAAYAAMYGLPAFADGGYHSGGVALVGERGPELADFRQPARIYSAEQTRSMVGDTAALLAELRALRAEVAALRKPAETSARHAEESATTLSRVTRGGRAMQTEAFA